MLTGIPKNWADYEIWDWVVLGQFGSKLPSCPNKGFFGKMTVTLVYLLCPIMLINISHKSLEQINEIKKFAWIWAHSGPNCPFLLLT